MAKRNPKKDKAAATTSEPAEETRLAVEQLKRWHDAGTRLAFQIRFGFFGFACLGKLVSQDPDGLDWWIEPGKEQEVILTFTLRGIDGDRSAVRVLKEDKDQQTELRVIDIPTRYSLLISERPLARLPLLSELLI